MSSLPQLPATHSDFLSYIKANSNTPINELLKPYNEYDSALRQIFAQEPSHSILTNNHINVVPLYGADGVADLRIQARDLDSEPQELTDKYLLPLKDEDRRSDGSPAVVTSFKEFQTNFNLFSESSLSDLDWSNVIAAGSSVVTALLPVPDKYKESKRQLRHFYHEKFAPASDVDLFIYGLNEEQTIEKIKQIEQKIKDSILYETTSIRTKNTITIVSQYPTRHVQVVLRIYKSLAEIITGFDVDCSCVAYDGKNVYAAPRAIAAFMTQTNQIDLMRRSPSYENRLSKYSHRGFEVFWPELDRSRIDPTIFERSFMRTTGLARLLVLKQLPTSRDRDEYTQKRRAERGRPPSHTSPYRNIRKLRGNIKNDWEDEVAEWVDEEDISDYHTITIPYGEKFHARKIEKLLYTHDLLLNAEWNNQEREVALHRHPVFFGDVEDIIHDCCGSCPKPSTPEEEEVWEKESKIYISGKVTFIKDDPGRQAIGSFNPITETDWTEMAYIGNTARLFQAIADNDIETVREWLSRDDADPNRRDHTGRSPLHLATMVSTPEIVQCIVDHGARLIARLADGRMALHLAAERGSVDIIRILLHKSEENEEAEEEKKDQQRATKKNPQTEAEDVDMTDLDNMVVVNENPDDSDEDKMSLITGSFVDIKKEDVKMGNEETIPDDIDESEPDIIDINTVAWDCHATPLHLAIVHGHVEVVKELVSSFGADVLLPIKLPKINCLRPDPGAILPLTLPLKLSQDQTLIMIETLLKLGATPAQADLSGRTPLHYFAARHRPALFDILTKHDPSAVKRAIDHLAVEGVYYSGYAESVLTVAVDSRDPDIVEKLLSLGAPPDINFSKYIQVATRQCEWLKSWDADANLKRFQQHIVQPVVAAILTDQPLVALKLLQNGVDPNTLSILGYTILSEKHASNPGESLLDLVDAKICLLQDYKETCKNIPPTPLQSDEVYLAEYPEGSYQLCFARDRLEREKASFKRLQEEYEKAIKEAENRKGLEEKKSAVTALLHDYQALHSALVTKGAKTFKEIYPDAICTNNTQPRVNKPQKRGEVKIGFNFNVADLSGGRKEGYIKLFEAAWSGDIETIKSLTLSMWGPDKQMSPLIMSVNERMGASPFSIAVLRGHFDAAKAILQIVRAQYKPKTVTRQTYHMQSDDEDESDAGESQEEDGLQITGEGVCDELTIDNIGEVTTQAESDVSPLNVLRRSCRASLIADPTASEPPLNHINLFNFAVEQDNIELLRFLLDLGQSEIVSGACDGPYELLSSTNFNDALRDGQPRCIAMIISRTGAHLPLDKFVEEGGITIKQKPKYYQGLSIHGKKREDWAAAAGQDAPSCISSESDIPLLRAALAGSLVNVEWFLGTAPKRHYMEFANSNRQDKRLRKLSQLPGGVEKFIEKWLSSRNDLLLHCAIMGRETDESLKLVKYIIENVPGCLERKSSKGYTPLLLAFSKRRPRFAKALIEAGANMEARDVLGNNILHILNKHNGSYSSVDTNFKELLDLLDPSVVPSLLTCRSADGPGALTPFAAWINYLSDHYRWVSGTPVQITKLLLDFAKPTGQAHLELLDGSGNTPLHIAVRHKFTPIVKLILECNPKLLTIENSTGTTPMDLVRDGWTTNATTTSPELPERTTVSQWGKPNYSPAVLSKDPESFVSENKQDTCDHSSIYKLCLGVWGRLNQKKRKLVSLFEANEVAKRVERRVRSRHFRKWAVKVYESDSMAEGRQARRRARHGYSGSVRSSDGEDDEVSKWHKLY
ncbi:Ankyrin repeat-containing domain [Trichophyton interdigitale]|uniref:Ankyrin repeat-containing domain n=1 Tax=Trichophyton interdigitale TaxID=101480 RepID=A0A9P4YM37_9EURO|nr:Ankyrin repeat-containing domain [Trichophyton interdigitale]KAF3901164.1 Ankyrin repeat-containing domain [Trichophyton interdigitale]KAG8211308.1 Ankyrin repeat-containing domain [Trichophyton interdigitale]